MINDRNIISKKTNKGSSIVIWRRNDYLMETGKQLKDKKVYQEVSNNDNILSKLEEMSNKMFGSLKKRGCITEKELKYFSYEYRKAKDFSKLYFFPKIHKRLHNVPERTVISNCGTPTEKCS